MKFILGTKQEMTQMFREDGKAEPVTLVFAEPVEVSLIRTKEKDGYAALQVKRNKVRREARLRDTKYMGAQDAHIVGVSLTVSQFAVGDRVTIASISKSKGFQGGVKRHGFHGASNTHGVKHAHRQPGSIGAGGVQRVLKGQRMAGRMGGDRVTMRGVRVVNVYPDKHIIALKGGIPGHRGSLVEIRG
ncbi:MAG: 50S ribosomal protein L3 [Candidatus Ryanbacteria bacterium RIFCSPLOWO2_02_FULL_45_11c]|uniref:Large ribosomal subunit protein uL3 n=1 Tax=Candidatus Ryanbacteria bacterium RIFCSPLOWO2_02_FULL_45_11c TaxID=1802128 RepID=A0A1G2GXW0_9BACT|nr:MAG: 50S ribosomal protein L3 [Candidatus Ryanbacteria bacterium RIFCSPLOWO2_02_FULL_45_11c]